MIDKLMVNEQRLMADFSALAQIGAVGDGGINRPALSEAHLAARAWYKRAAEMAGLGFSMDRAGNHSAVLASGKNPARTLLLGSHLDSVPNGGRFDGALGVLAALETLRTIQDARLDLPVNLEAIDFTDEEGTLVGLLGSSALVGCLTSADLQTPRGGNESLHAALTRARLKENDLLEAKREAHSLVGYLELHIEQGPLLEKSKKHIGVVTGIVGISSYRLRFSGRADHAGTTPVIERRDAAQGASAFILAVREIILDDFPECVANIGWIEFKPGVFNIVPERVELALEYRALHPERMRQLETALLESAEACARRFNLSMEAAKLGEHDGVEMHPAVMDAIRQAADSLGLSTMSLPSGAGHDAQMLARICPAGMIFIPSQEGASHSPREFSAWQDCINGTNVLLRAALHLARNG